MRTELDGFVDDVRQELDDDQLLGVFWGNFKERDYSVIYLHPGVREELSAGTAVDFVQTLAEEQLPTHEHRELEHTVGELDLSIRMFEEVTEVLAWNTERQVGVFVALMPSAENLEPTVEALRELDI